MALQLGPEKQAARGTVTFTLNGQEHVVSPERVAVDTRLVDYVRYHVHATGTKVMCREGGCGACVVVASAPDLGSRSRRVFSVQACLLLVYACDGWEIQTIEYLGDRYKGYHQIQKALAGFYGTQCGYCSPGMCMTMHGETQRRGALTSQQVEEALDGNICRCTGYRPILDAFKSLALDATPRLKEQLADIEDAYKSTCPKTGAPCGGKCSDASDDCHTLPPDTPITCDNSNGSNVSYLTSILSSLFASSDSADPTADARLSVSASSGRWFYPVTGKGVLNALKLATPQDNVLLVAGNTGSGVFKDDGPYTMFISLEKVPELQQITREPTSLKIGARVPLTTCIEVFRKAASGPVALPGYAHLEEIADHWQVVANLAVRNNGSWAGNLMLKNRHNDFPSDIFLTLAACDTTLLIGNAVTNKPEHVKVIDFPSYDMDKKVIVGMSIPPQPSGVQIVTFKITPRAVNAHAYVNAAFRFPLKLKFLVIGVPKLLFGGLGGHFVSASKTEKFLAGKSLADERVVQQAARLLAGEAVPTVDPEQGSVEYRQSLVQTLFYKAVLKILQKFVSPSLRSAGDKLQRGLSSGQQDFDANSDSWPIGQAIPKIESLVQVAGEAEYADDVPALPGELHGQFVLTKFANARIDRVDASQALAMPGVVDFVTAVDIPGTNSYYIVGIPFIPPKPDPVFATERSIYHGQPVGLVVAEDRDTAHAAAKLVQVTYSDIKKPVLHTKDAVKAGRLTGYVKSSGTPQDDHNKRDAALQGEAGKKTNQIKGEVEINTQYHFPMELVIARAAPIEDGYDIVCCTQFTNETQKAVADVLNVPAHSVNLSVRRLGGAFGVKITRCNLAACAVAVAAAKTRRPVRLFMDLHTSMAALGWREPYYATYEVSFDNSGKLETVRTLLYPNCGHTDNESSAALARDIVPSVYSSSRWDIASRNALTDCSANTWCRAPGHVEGIAIIETIISHVAAVLGKDPLAVQELNLAPSSGQDTNVFKDSILPLLREKASIDRRKQEVEQFNRDHRWRKRGLSVTPMRFNYPYYSSFRFTAQVVIYEHDGTVAISHGGIEMGQGINTKAAQVAAAILEVPVELIKIKPTNTFIAANDMVTGGSLTSDVVCHAVQICCERLKDRIDAIKNNLDTVPTWPELIKACLLNDVDLSERYWTLTRELPKNYVIWGGTCIEVEVDVLTGVHVTRRVDIIEDAGRSLSPYVDIGQVEGAFVMGLGLFTTEYMQFDEQTGEKLVTGTWEYKPFTAMDIPADMRVTLLPNAPNPYGVLRSKATGEPPLCMSYGIVSALRQAITAARADAGVTGWFEMPSPMTVERVQQLCLVERSQFVLSDREDLQSEEALSLPQQQEQEQEDGKEDAAHCRLY